MTERKRTAHVVYAYKVAVDPTSPVRMHWRCSCGGGGEGYPGATTACSYCHQIVTLPDEPMDAGASQQEPATGVESQPSTAWKLAAYRSELHACGFSSNDARALVLIAARNTPELTVGPLFVARAEPPAPIVRIENHEPGSPKDLAIRKRLGLDEDAE